MNFQKNMKVNRRQKIRDTVFTGKSKIIVGQMNSSIKVKKTRYYKGIVNKGKIL